MARFVYAISRPDLGEFARGDSGNDYMDGRESACVANGPDSSRKSHSDAADDLCSVEVTKSSASGPRLMLTGYPSIFVSASSLTGRASGDGASHDNSQRIEPALWCLLRSGKQEET